MKGQGDDAIREKIINAAALAGQYSTGVRLSFLWKMRSESDMYNYDMSVSIPCGMGENIIYL